MGWLARALAIWKVLSTQVDTADSHASLDLAERGEHKAGRLKAQLGEVYDDLRASLRLVKQYLRGNYRAVSATTIAAILGAIAYFLMPMDAIPDWILGLGLLDDVLIMSRVFAMAREDIRAFRAWEREHGQQPADEHPCSPPIVSNRFFEGPTLFNNEDVS